MLNEKLLEVMGNDVTEEAFAYANAEQKNAVGVISDIIHAGPVDSGHSCSAPPSPAPIRRQLRQGTTLDRTHYDNLQVARNASDEVIKGAYKYLSQKWHPDRQPPEKRAEAERVMKLINTAYSVLIDPVARKKHDEWIREREESEGLSESGGRGSSTAGAGSAGSPLSDDVREHFVETVAANAWPLFTIQALFVNFFWLFILFLVAKLFGFLPALERFIAKYPWVCLFAFLGLSWSSYGFAKTERRKALCKLSDDLLSIKFQETKSRKLIFIAVSIALLIGGMIAFAVWNRSDSTAVSPPQGSTGGAGAAGAAAQTERDVPPLARPAPESSPQPSPKAERAERAMPSPDVDRLRIGNECNNPVEVIVALEERSNFQMFNKTVPADSDKTYTIRKSDIEDRAPEVYWTARSEDRKTVWVEKDVNAGGAFWIEGEQILFFPLAKERDGSYYVRLSCPTSS